MSVTRKEDLEIKLLEAKISSIEKQNSRGIVREMVPSLLTIVLSIVASVVLVEIGDRVVKDARDKLFAINKDISEAKNELVILTQKKDEIESSNYKLLGKSVLFDSGIDLDVEIKSINSTDIIVASSNIPELKIQAFDSCAGKFSFPSEIPIFTSCIEYIGDCTTVNDVYSCKFGPLSILTTEQTGIWLTATHNNMQTVRYVQL